MRFESQNSGVCSCTHCYHSTGPEEAYSASESILEEVSETVMCGDCMQNYTCRCHLTCETTSPDAVNPYHYTRLNPQPVDLINAWNLDYLEGTVIKYLSRWRYKNGVEDLQKAKRFLEMLIERESR